MKLSRIKIKELIFAELQNKHFTIIDENQADGYYIFKYDKNTVWHFKLKECKGWLCGLWITEDDNKPEQHLVSLFAQRIKCIDKFKPSCSNIISTFYVDKNMKKNDYDSFVKFYSKFNISSFVRDMTIVKQMPLYSKWLFSGIIEYGESPIKYILEDFYDYNIRKPFKRFYENKFEPTYVNFIYKIYNALLPKSKVAIEFISKPANWWPRYFFNLKFTDKTTEKSRWILYKLFVKELFILEKDDDKGYYKWQIRFLPKKTDTRITYALPDGKAYIYNNTKNE